MVGVRCVDVLSVEGFLSRNSHVFFTEGVFLYKVHSLRRSSPLRVFSI